MKNEVNANFGDDIKDVALIMINKAKELDATIYCKFNGVGVLLQISTQQGSNVAEALQFIPNVKIETDEKGIKSITKM